MNPARLINNIKKRPDYHHAGMILCHNGVVRSTSRDGRKVSGLTISVDHAKLEQVIESNKKTLGIVEMLVEFNENRKLSIGDDEMFMVVAGDLIGDIRKLIETARHNIAVYDKDALESTDCGMREGLSNE